MSILVKNGLIVTLDEHNTCFENGDLLIQGDTIEALGTELGVEESSVLQVVDASGMLVMPGLVNCHIHTGERMMRGMTPGLPNEIWNLFIYPPIGEAFDIDPRLFYLQTMVSAIECIKSGVTAVHDQSREWHISPHPGAAQAYFSAYEQAGLRAEIAICFVDKTWHETITGLTEQLPPDILAKMSGGDDESHWKLNSLAYATETCEHYISRWHGYDNRFTIAIDPSAPQRCTDAMLVHLGEIARKHRVSYQLHLLETRMQLALSQRPPYNGSIVKYLYDLGLLGPKTSLAHAIWLRDKDIELLADTGASVIHNPVCNQFMGSGVMPLVKYIEKGVPVAIATDGIAGNGSMSMFESMKMAALIHNTTTADFNQWPSPLQILHMATRNGARCLGLEDQIGILKPGMKADMILLKQDTISFTPLYDVYNQLVFAEDGTSVDTVMIGGRLVMEDRKLKNIDEGAIIQELQTYLPRLEAFRQHAISCSKPIYPILEKVYHQISKEAEEWFSK